MLIVFIATLIPLENLQIWRSTLSVECIPVAIVQQQKKVQPTVPDGNILKAEKSAESNELVKENDPTVKSVESKAKMDPATVSKPKEETTYSAEEEKLTWNQR